MIHSPYVPQKVLKVAPRVFVSALSMFDEINNLHIFSMSIFVPLSIFEGVQGAHHAHVGIFALV
jgi:hypothetical protein